MATASLADISGASGQADAVARRGADSAPGQRPHVAVVIPCYRVRRHVLSVIERIGAEVSTIYVVDDGCPEHSGAHVTSSCGDPRVRVLAHAKNRGVGAAVMTGYLQAAADGAEIVVKLDGDGQMNPRLIPAFVDPIARGEADYVKGNRFYNPADVRSMPIVRLLGNAALSFLSKLSTGYWSIFDPTNGYTAIHASIVKLLQTEKISERYFFESDLLFRLYLLRCVVTDVPMQAVYGDESSSLSIRRVLFGFALGHLRNIGKRLFYSYFLRDFSVASLQLVFGALLGLFGTLFGAWTWYRGAASATPTPVGTVMLAALPIILGVQLFLAFLSYDVMNQPRQVVHRRTRSYSEAA